MAHLDEWLEKLQRSLRMRDGVSAALPGAVVYQFEFARDAPCHLVCGAREFRFAAGTHRGPDITLYLDCHGTLAALLKGELDGMSAFMAGRYRADGNLVLSQVLLYQFERG